MDSFKTQDNKLTKKGFMEQTFDILIVGIMGSGKTTVANALLGEDIYAKSDDFVRIVKFGSNSNEVEIHKHYNDTNDVSVMTHNDFLNWRESFLKESYRAFHNNGTQFLPTIDYIAMNSKNEFLLNNIRIVEIPGLTTSFKDKASNSDVVIFVLSGYGPSSHERRLIEQNLHICSVNVFFVINKFDCIRKEESEIVKSKVKDALKFYYTKTDGNVDVELMNRRVFFTSANLALCSKRKKYSPFGKAIDADTAKKMMVSSLFPPFEKELVDFINSESSKKQYDTAGLVKVLKSYPCNIGDYCKEEINKIVSDINVCYQSINEMDFSIAVVGDFSVGKSSFINAFIGKNILPVSVIPCTAAISRIAYGTNEHAEVIYKNKTVKSLTIDEFKEFSSYSIEGLEELNDTGEFKRLKDVEQIIIYVDSDILRDNKLCIVDTLGLSNNNSDTQKTLNAIEGAISIIYVCAERGLTDPDRKFISKYLNPGNDNFYMCINRIDLVYPPKDAIIDKVQFDLNYLLLSKGDAIASFPTDRLFPVSSRYQSYANGFDHDDESWDENINYQLISGFPAFITKMCNYVNTNTEKAKSIYLTEHLRQYLERISRLSRHISEQTAKRENEIELSIKELTENNNKSTQKIEYIRSRYSVMFQECKLKIANLNKEVNGRVNRYWDDYFANIRNQVHFSIGDFLSIKLNLFLTEEEINQKKRDLLAPFCKVITKYYVNKINTSLNDILSSVREVLKRYEKEGLYINFQDTEIYFHQPHSIFNSQLENSISEIIWDILSRDGALWNIMVEWLMENANVTNNISELLGEAKNTILNNLQEPLSGFVNDISTKCENTFQKNCKYVTSQYQKSIDDNETQISTLELEKSKLIYSEIDIKDYFDKVGKILRSSLQLSDIAN